MLVLERRLNVHSAPCELAFVLVLPFKSHAETIGDIILAVVCKFWNLWKPCPRVAMASAVHDLEDKMHSSPVSDPYLCCVVPGKIDVEDAFDYVVDADPISAVFLVSIRCFLGMLSVGVHHPGDYHLGKTQALAT